MSEVFFEELSVKLLPCPFCGCAEPHLVRHQYITVVTCRCGATMTAVEPSEAASMWNARYENNTKTKTESA